MPTATLLTATLPHFEQRYVAYCAFSTSSTRFLSLAPYLAPNLFVVPSPALIALSTDRQNKNARRPLESCRANFQVREVRGVGFEPTNPYGTGPSTLRL